jgi:hypothetical protein
MKYIMDHHVLNSMLTDTDSDEYDQLISQIPSNEIALCNVTFGLYISVVDANQHLTQLNKNNIKSNAEKIKQSIKSEGRFYEFNESASDKWSQIRLHPVDGKLVPTELTQLIGIALANELTIIGKSQTAYSEFGVNFKEI